ncbi:uncharacterized protein [Coffea arabica]|uniref:Uncharacterized protein n=1 Tax=Coffea arabica TaxID=13443 RepID=A0A6P6X1I6_COFAR
MPVQAKIVADMVAASGTMDTAKDAVELPRRPLKPHLEMRIPSPQIVADMVAAAGTMDIAKDAVHADMVAAAGTMDIAKDAVHLLRRPLKLHPEMRSKINAK